MFDTMTSTKIIGAFCGALLVFMLGKWAADSLYSMGGAHGDEEHMAGYVIEIGDEEGAAKEEEAGPTFEELMAAADPDKGAKVFSKCKACHKASEGEHSTGPSLYGVVGRAIGAAAGFEKYSGKLNQVGDIWSPENLDAFLADPRGTAAGTTMSFGGLKKAEDRADLIAYLDSLDG